MADYLKLGYLPEPARYSVSTSLDYAYDDWCVAQIARKLNHLDVAQPLMARAQNYRKLWDPVVGLMRGRKEDGSWDEPFDEFKWQGPYAESGPWQASWVVAPEHWRYSSAHEWLVGGHPRFKCDAWK